MSVDIFKKCMNAADDIMDDYISIWHSENKGKQELYEYLSMTKEEYEYYVVNGFDYWLMKRMEEKFKNKT